MNPVKPRVSLIVAMDNFGAVYITICQANTDDDIMKVFLIELVKLLDQEDILWKESSFFLWDNAGYHSSSRTLGVMKALNIPI